LNPKHLLRKPRRPAPNRAVQAGFAFLPD